MAQVTIITRMCPIKEKCQVFHSHLRKELRRRCLAAKYSRVFTAFKFVTVSHQKKVLPLYVFPSIYEEKPSKVFILNVELGWKPLSSE